VEAAVSDDPPTSAYDDRTMRRALPVLICAQTLIRASMPPLFVLTAVLATALALALALLLWLRWTAARRELIALRRELETRVNERTAELADRTRELAEANDTRSRFFARVSHEIRTPLSGILGINRMLMQTGLEGRQRELAEIVQAQGGTLLTIINDILDYSKMEAGRFGLAASDFSLRDTIDEAARIHGEQARAKNVGFVVEVDPSLPSDAHGDAVRLRQVLDNLLSNAVKFTDRGSIKLRATRLASDPADVVARFEVADTGIGLGAAAARVLFQPFMQADSSTTRRHGGTGLGLAIAKSLVEMMGGEIGCLGEPGHGSTFWFTIRVEAVRERGEAPALPAATAPATPRPSATRRGHVLLAEDNAINGMVGVALLEEAGCTVDVVGTGVEAVAACASRRYDLVLMDCRMPEMDGYRATAEIRRAEAGASRVPIVALTAHAVDSETERCNKAGMDDCITKPASPEIIARVLDRWLRAASPLSTDTLDDLERRSPAVLRTVIEHYVAGIPTDVARLRTAVGRGDRERIADIAHDLAGSAMVVGARDLATLLRVVEGETASVDLAAWIDRVSVEHLHVIDALQARIRPEGERLMS
jgi:signal transduction histidine kinase/FixJ family two-component response regulator